MFEYTATSNEIEKDLQPTGQGKSPASDVSDKSQEVELSTKAKTECTQRCMVDSSVTERQKKQSSETWCAKSNSNSERVVVETGPLNNLHLINELIMWASEATAAIDNINKKLEEVLKEEEK